MPRIDEKEERPPFGVSCDHERRGLVLTVGGGRFVVGRGQLRVMWDDGRSLPQDRRVACADVADVVVAPDRRGVAGHLTWRLEVVLKDGQVLLPVRHSKRRDVWWVAGRLRRELGLPPSEPLPESEREPARRPRQRSAVRGEIEVLKAKPPPRPVPSVERIELPGRLVLRLERVSAHQMNRGVWLVIALFSGVAVGATLFAIVHAAGGPGAPLAVFTCSLIAVVAVGTAVWMVWINARDGARRHAVHLSARGLRAGSTPARRKDPRRDPRFIPREQIEGFGSGISDGPGMRESQLHVYLKDGTRVGLFNGRPADELAWASHLLSRALEAAESTAPTTSVAEPEAADRSRVLPYEAQLEEPRGLRVRHWDDGGVTVTLFPSLAEQVMSLIGLLVVLAVLAGVGLFLLVRPVPSNQLLANTAGLVAVALTGAGLAALFIGYVRRLGQPTVVGVDSTNVYYHCPSNLEKPRQWPREKVVDVRQGKQKGRNATTRYVEIVIDNGERVEVAPGRGDWERHRILNALRDALGMKQ